MAYLVVINGFHQGERFDLTDDEFLIGNSCLRAAKKQATPLRVAREIGVYRSPIKR